MSAQSSPNTGGAGRPPELSDAEARQAGYSFEDDDAVERTIDRALRDLRRSVPPAEFARAMAAQVAFDDEFARENAEDASRHAARFAARRRWLVAARACVFVRRIPVARREARPRARRAGASSRTSSADPGSGDPEPPPPRLALSPPPGSVYPFAGQRSAILAAVAS